MAQTDTLTINNQSWTEVPYDGTYLAIQVNTSGIIRIHISDVAPADDNETGVIIARQRDGIPGSFSAGGLKEGDGVYARLVGTSDDEIDIIFLTY